MTTATPDEYDLVVSTDAAEEKAKLQKHFGRSDIYFFLVCTLFGVDGLGTLAGKGGAGFTWLVLSLLLFAVPTSLILAELGAAYTDEGGPYIWVRMAFGHLVAAVNNFFYWITNPVWMGGTLVGTAVGGLSVFIHSGSDWSKTAWYVFGIVFIWAGVLFAVLSFKVGKWVATIGAFARFALLGVFMITVIIYGAKHGVHGLGFSDYKPDFSSFVALVPLILFSMVGFELPSAAGEEMQDAANDVPAGILKSVVTTGLLYALPVFGILTVIPATQVSGLDGFPSAVRQALTVFGGSVHAAGDGTVTAHLSGFGEVVGLIMGILVAIVAFTSGLTWIMGSDRTLAVSCYDGAGPRYFGQFSERFGTPVRVNILSGIFSTIVFIATLEITGGNAAKFFSVALNMAISTTLISYLFIFPAAWVLRRQRPGDARPFRAPWLPVLTIISTIAIIFCTIQILFPGLGDDWFGPDYVWEGWKSSERWTFFLTEFIPVVVFVAVGVIFWAMGRAHVRRSEAAR